MKNDDLLQFEDEQIIIFKKVFNSDNFNFIRHLFHEFCYYKGFKICGKNSYYSSLFTDLYLEFYMDKRIMYSSTWTAKDFLKWFKEWLANYEDIILTDDDNKELNKITHRLRFELKKIEVENEQNN